MTHLTDEQAQRWVSGTCEDAEAQRIEDHARTCRACEALLVAEARAEVMTQALAQVPSAWQARARRALVIAVPLALAASLLLTVLGAPVPCRARSRRGHQLDCASV